MAWDRLTQGNCCRVPSSLLPPARKTVPALHLKPPKGAYLGREVSVVVLVAAAGVEHSLTWSSQQPASERLGVR